MKETLSSHFCTLNEAVPKIVQSREHFPMEVPHGCRNTLGTMLDWTAAREELVRLYLLTGLSEIEFARRVGVNRNTVQRIERKRDYEPRVGTIERWLIVCVAGPVGAFLQRFEKGMTPTVTELRHTLPIPQGGAGDVTSSVPVVLSADEARFAEKIAFILLGAVATQRLDPALLRAGGTLADGDSDRPSVGRSDSETVPRVKGK